MSVKVKDTIIQIIIRQIATYQLFCARPERVLAARDRGLIADDVDDVWLARGRPNVLLAASPILMQ